MSAHTPTHQTDPLPTLSTACRSAVCLVPLRRRALRCIAGSALVEALVALVLIAIAGLIVATASVAGLRATRRAATLAGVTALAERELALAANRAATVVDETTTLLVPGIATPFDRTVAVDRTASIVSITVRIAGGRPSERVTLATRARVEP